MPPSTQARSTVGGEGEDISRVAVIVGGSRGIGLESARLFLADGWRVCVTGRKEDGLVAAREELACKDDALLTVAGASQDPEHQQETVQGVLDRWGRIDALVNNVATSPFYGDVLDATIDQFRRALEVNLVAPWAWSQLVYERAMREHGGSIVNMGSVGGTHPVRRVGVYNISKAGLHFMTKQLAFELAPKVRVNAVVPATIATAFSRAKYEGREESIGALYPLNRIGYPDEVGALVFMLCNGTTDWITGQMFVIDGGESLLQGVV